jgi:hypothetical protein
MKNKKTYTAKDVLAGINIVNFAFILVSMTNVFLIIFLRQGVPIISTLFSFNLTLCLGLCLLHLFFFPKVFRSQKDEN